MSHQALWGGIKLSLQAQTLDVRLQAALIDVIIEMGLYVTALFKAHAIEAIDSRRHALDKPIDEAIALIDEALAWVKKHESEGFDVDARFTSHAQKQSLDALSLEDKHTKAWGSLQADPFYCALSLSFALRRPLEDVALIVDLASVATEKSAIEWVSMLDAIRSALGLVRSDLAQMGDDAQRALGKAIGDVFQVTDDVDGALSTLDDQNVAFFKSLNELTGVGDDFERLIRYERTLIENVALSSSLAKVFDQERLNRFEVNGNALRHLDKPAADRAGLQGEMAVDLTRTHRHELLASALLSHWLERTRQDVLLCLEAISHVIDKPMAESVSVDELIDVKQAKGAREHIALADSLLRSIGFQRAWLDEYAISDMPAKVLGRSNEKAFAVSNSLERLPAKWTSDSLSVDERLSRYAQRVILDLSAVRETLTKLMQSSLQETALGLRDQVIGSSFKSSNDAIQTLEQLKRAIGMQRTEFVALSALLAKHGNVGYSDGLNVRDLSLRSPGKAAQDTGRVNDTGSLWSQGYALDPSYFAGEYVGVVRAF